jgi:hypothetical protein
MANVKYRLAISIECLLRRSLFPCRLTVWSWNRVSLLWRKFYREIKATRKSAGHCSEESFALEMGIGSDGNRGRGKARRRRGRRLLMVRLLLLLGRFFCRLLRCFLLRHEHSTSLRCQSMDRFRCCISDFVHRVKCLPSGFLRSEWARTPIRDFGAGSLGKGFCVSKM